MKFRHFALGAAAAVLAGATTLPVQAQDTIYVPLLTYRTGPFANSGIPIADGMHDYLRMLNERDGGIGGAKIVIEECETGYDTIRVSNVMNRPRAKTRSFITPTPPASRCR